MKLRLFISIFALIFTDLAFSTAHSQVVSHEKPIWRSSTGLRLALNQAHLITKFKISEEIGFYAQGGYQFRYLTGYSWNGLLVYETQTIGPGPNLASYGPVGEFGILWSLPNKVCISFGFQYKHTRIDKGHEDYRYFTGETNAVERIFWREDTKKSIKILIIGEFNRYFEPFIGIGSRHIKTTKHLVLDGTFSRMQPSSNILKSEFVVPTFHLGINFYLIRFGKIQTTS